MTELIALYLIALLVITGAVMLVQARRQRTDLLSIRNFVVLRVQWLAVSPLVLDDSGRMGLMSTMPGL